MGRGKRKDWLLITCEHGGNRVPPRYAGWFRGYEAMLETHRGFDFGALQMGRELSRSLEAPLVASTVTRLLVDLNRSMGRRDLLSPASRQAPPAERERMLREHYRPYRERVEHLVGTAIARGRRVVHVSSHSFTPRLHGKVRRADVGLLCDASRSAERTTCENWKAALRRLAPELRVRRNYPYWGSGDGLTSHLRKRHAPSEYVGIELEINQALVTGSKARWARVRAEVVASLQSTLDVRGAVAGGER
jgi:predicted N-formylglutamate amidohydrolase